MIKCIIKKIVVLSCIFTLLFVSATVFCHAIDTSTHESKIIVSLGDSYSSGEGIPPFYGSELHISQKVINHDWLAHRSKMSWPSMLTLPSINKTMVDHRNENWFFTAVSGATTWNFDHEQNKTYAKSGGLGNHYSGTAMLPAQQDVFDKLDGQLADYVTLTLGGNDADFVGIIIEVMMGSSYLNTSKLTDKINNTWKEFYKENGIRDNLKSTYEKIEKKAGSQAKIIVAGYPQLLDPKGKGILVSKQEAQFVDSAVTNFNNEIERLVQKCERSGMNIFFVSVEDEFRGHEAYSGNSSYINSASLLKADEDIEEGGIGSAYSFHPNLNGAKAYARCVQRKIDELEKEKNSTSSSGNPKIYNNTLNIAERDVVLVLDSSGSMDGKPLEETKKAAIKFVNTVLGQGANIGIVKYDGKAEIVSPFSTDENALIGAINNIDSGGATNIEDGLSTAESMLSSSSANKKIIVLMSDGEPNNGKVGDELIAYANELKNKDTYIYTLGFFESISDKTNAQYLMEKIASDGCHYEVSDADSLVYFFGDIADQINGQKYIYVRIACPVDISVSYNGETLNSAENALSTRTSFGSLTFEDADTQAIESYNSNTSTNQSDESDDKVKILRLKEGEDYDIKIEGTGKGRMNYSIGFMDENGEYSDFRKFNNVKITRKTQIDTVAKVSDKTVLNVDEDGDGKYDLTYEARANSRGEIVDNSFIINLILILLGVLVLLIIILIIYKKVQKTKIKKSRRDYNG